MTDFGQGCHSVLGITQRCALLKETITIKREWVYYALLSMLYIEFVRLGKLRKASEYDQQMAQ